MCLLKTTPMQRATKDITCYKIIQIYHLPDGDDYRSYFQHAKIELNEPILSSWSFDIQDLNGRDYLYGQVVHAYCGVSCDDSDTIWYIADTERDPYFGKCNVSIVKVECIIPKGTLFCKGTDDDNNLCYGATEIIPKRVIETIKTIIR